MGESTQRSSPHFPPQHCSAPNARCSDPSPRALVPSTASFPCNDRLLHSLASKMLNVVCGWGERLHNLASQMLNTAGERFFTGSTKHQRDKHALLADLSSPLS